MAYTATWTRQRVLDKITDGVRPECLARRAHIIQDFLFVHGEMWVKTRAHDWHPATLRERAVLKHHKEN